MICPSCSKNNPPNSKFCNNCGHKITENVKPTNSMNRLEQYIPKALLEKLQASESGQGIQNERRIVTILFCDVEGSTAAAEKLDPEDWAEIMNDAFEYLIKPVYRYEGTVGRLQGDGLLCFFGAPISHEDDPRRAVLAGLDIIKDLKPYSDKIKKERGFEFNVRVGINTGLVVIGDIGSDLRVEYTAMGNTVNLAARMEQTAHSGTVQISEYTYKHVVPFFDIIKLGTIKAKGISNLIAVYRPTNVKIRPGKIREVEGLESPLVGRDTEYQALKDVITNLIKGNGQIVSLRAEAGLGKSRLLLELYQGLKSQRKILIESYSDMSEDHLDSNSHLFWIEVSCLSYEKNTPFMPFIKLFTRFFDFTLEDSNQFKIDKIKSVIDLHFPRAEQEISLFLSTLLSLELEEEDKEKVKYLNPPQLRERIFHSIKIFIEILASKHPVTLVFDDLHWNDPTSFECLQNLFPLVKQIPLALLGIYRPLQDNISGEFHALAQRSYNQFYTSIQLSALSQQNTHLLVTNLLQNENLKDNWDEQIVAKTDGNPFFVEEVVRSLVERNIIKFTDNKWQTTEEITNITITIPDTLAGVLTTRLDQLDQESKYIAQTASVIGREFQHDILSAIYDIPTQLNAGLITLEQRDLIKEKVPKPIKKYWFKHGLTQEAAYTSLLLKKRRQIHREIAEWFEAQEEVKRNNDIAYHYFEAQDFELALPYLIKAGDQAAQSSSLKEAIKFYSMVIEIEQKSKDLNFSRRAYEGLGNISLLDNQPLKALETFQNMKTIAQEHKNELMEASALNKIGFVSSIYLGNISEAEKCLAEAETIAYNLDAFEELAETKVVQCYIYTSLGKLPEAEKTQTEAVKIGLKIKKVDTQLFGLTHHGNTLLYMMKFEESYTVSQRAYKIAIEYKHLQYISEILAFSLSYYHYLKGELTKAKESAQEGLEYGKRIGFNFSITTGNYTLGLIARLMGDYELSTNYLKDATEASEKTSLAYLMSMANTFLGTTYFEITNKNWNKTSKLYNKALKIMEMPLGSSMGGIIWAEMGNVYLARSDPEKAEYYFQKGLTTLTPVLNLARPLQLIGLAEVALNSMDSQLAFAKIHEAEKFSDKHGINLYRPFISLTKGKVAAAQNHHEKAVELFKETINIGQSENMQPIIWKSYVQMYKSLIALKQIEYAERNIDKANSIIKNIANLISNSEMRKDLISNWERQLK